MLRLLRPTQNRSLSLSQLKLATSNASVHTADVNDEHITEKTGNTEKITEVDKEDEFTKEFLKNRVELTNIQRMILSVGSSVASLVDPRRHDMIAALGETTGVTALQNNLKLMRECKEGQNILADRPRINTKTVNLEELRQLPKNSFGRAYVKFLDDNQVTPDSRMQVRFMDDPELAYVMTRYRECHDLVHTILGMPTHMLGEVAVKWVEALNIGLPMCYGGAVFGAIRLRPKQRHMYKTYFLPWAIENGRKTKPLMCVYWEKRWQQDIDELRNELNVSILTLKEH